MDWFFEKKFLVALLLLGAASPGYARPVNLSLPLDLAPQSIATEFVPAGPGVLKEARVKAGLDLTVGRQLLAIDLDYDLLGQAVDAQQGGALTQLVKTRLTSNWLDSILDMKLGLETESELREGGDAYRHRLRPGLGGKLLNLAQVKLEYEYVLEKPSPLAVETSRRAYAVALDGALDEGRLTWQGRFRRSDEFAQGDVHARSTETLDLLSRYQLHRAIHVELSGALTNDTRFSPHKPQPVTQARYGAALGWAPSTRYALGVRIDATEQGSRERASVLGSGSISWFPRPDLELKLDYGDQLIEGAAGWMLHTRFDIKG